MNNTSSLPSRSTANFALVISTPVPWWLLRRTDRHSWRTSECHKTLATSPWWKSVSSLCIQYSWFHYFRWCRISSVNSTSPSLCDHESLHIITIILSLSTQEVPLHPPSRQYVDHITWVFDSPSDDSSSRVTHPPICQDYPVMPNIFTWFHPYNSRLQLKKSREKPTASGPRPAKALKRDVLHRSLRIPIDHPRTLLRVMYLAGSEKSGFGRLKHT